MEGTLGEIRLFAANFTPKTWAACNGALLAIAQNQALFAILGTTYGGDGRTTFGLPNLKGRTVYGAGTDPVMGNFQLGSIGGNSGVTLTGANLPQHNHTPLSGTIAITARQPVSSSPGTENSAENNILAGSTGGSLYSATNDGTKMAALTVTGGLVINGSSTAGASSPFNNIPPYLGMTYIICVQGLFPPRN